MEDIGFIHGPATGIVATPTYGAVLVNGDRTAVPAQQHVYAPPVTAYRIGMVRGIVTLIAAGAASITWYLATDSAGKRGVTEPVTSTIRKHAGADAEGWIVANIADVPFNEDSGSVRASLYFHGFTDAGTCTVEPFVYWSRRRT